MKSYRLSLKIAQKTEYNNSTTPSLAQLGEQP